MRYCHDLFFFPKNENETTLSKMTYFANPRHTVLDNANMPIVDSVYMSLTFYLL